MSVSRTAVESYLVRLLCTLSLSTTAGCASSTPKERVLGNMLIAGAAGALVGQNQSEYKNTYSTIYGALGAAIAGAVSSYIYLQKDEVLQSENESLKTKLEQFQKQLQPALVQKGNSLFSSPLPKEVAGLVEPGEWKRYKMDQWVQDPNQANTWYRQVEMFEIIPPVSK